MCCLLGAVVASAAPTIESSNGEITLSVGAVNDLAGGVFVQEVDADGRALGDRQRLVTEVGPGRQRTNINTTAVVEVRSSCEC